MANHKFLWLSSASSLFGSLFSNRVCLPLAWSLLATSCVWTIMLPEDIFMSTQPIIFICNYRCNLSVTATDHNKLFIMMFMTHQLVVLQGLSYEPFGHGLHIWLGLDCSAILYTVQVVVQNCKDAARLDASRGTCEESQG